MEFLGHIAAVTVIGIAIIVAVAAFLLYVPPVVENIPETIRFWRDRRELEDILAGCETCDLRIRHSHVARLNAFIEEHGLPRMRRLSERYVYGRANVLSFLFDTGPHIVELPHNKP